VHLRHHFSTTELLSDARNSAMPRLGAITRYMRFHQGVDPHDHVVEELLVEIMDVDPAIRRGIMCVTKGGLFEEGTRGNQPS